MPGGPHVIVEMLGLAALCAALSYVVNGRLMPLFRRYALARPNARSSHKVPTPQGGGAAVMIAFGLGLLILILVFGEDALWTWSTAMIVAGALVLAGLGGLDDVWSLPVLPRLATQVVAALLGLGAVFASNVTFLPPSVTLLAASVLLLALIWFINLTNFMDGIDGITVAEFIPLCGTLALLAAMGTLALPAGLLAAALLGALAGFAPYNRHVAKLFLGDVGSLPIGFVAGCLLMQLVFAGHLAAALILPLYYLADATLTLTARLLRGENVTLAHRTHFYQRATDLGWRVPAITRRIARVNLALGALAILSVLIGGPAWQVLFLGLACLLTIWLLRDMSRSPAS